MQAQGLEQNSQVVSSDLDIFQDLTSFQLLPQWMTAGRYGDPVGPRYSVAQILNTARYGPAALNSSSSPIISQQPQNQTIPIGGTATFSIQVNGSAVFYQWQGTDDGGSTWSSIAGANGPAYTTAPVSSSDNGAIFRCLVSTQSGSAWSWTATLNAANATAPSMLVSDRINAESISAGPTPSSGSPLPAAMADGLTGGAAPIAADVVAIASPSVAIAPTSSGPIVEPASLLQHDAGPRRSGTTSSPKVAQALPEHKPIPQRAARDSRARFIEN
jgi:hypothetical protein